MMGVSEEICCLRIELHTSIYKCDQTENKGREVKDDESDPSDDGGR